MKKNKLLIGFFLSLMVLILIEYIIYINYGTLSRKITNISFVVTGDNMDSWENLQAGAETAALDKDCVVNFVNCSNDAGVEGEIDTIGRQLKEGADYVVVAGDYKEQILDYISNNNLSHKVSFLSSDIKDDENMQKDFADFIEKTNTQSVLLLTNQSYGKLEELLNEKDIYFKTMNFAKFSFEENDAFKNYDIYAIDNSSEAVYYLDKEMLKGLAYRDDYSLGYITISHLLTGKSVDKLSKNVPVYYIVDKDSMYSMEMENVLFPFAK